MGVVKSRQQISLYLDDDAAEIWNSLPKMGRTAFVNQLIRNSVKNGTIQIPAINIPIASPPIQPTEEWLQRQRKGLASI